MADSDQFYSDDEGLFAPLKSQWKPSSNINGDVPNSANGIADKQDPDSKLPAGMICEATNLYQTKPDRYGSTTWVDKCPEDLEDPVENAKTARYALLIRNRKSYNPRKKLQIDSIMVQSPLLKTVLGRVLKGYPGITTSLDRLEFGPPFKPFVHRWADLVAALKGEEDTATRSHLELFHHVMEEELRDNNRPGGTGGREVCPTRERGRVDSRILIDTYAWNRFNPNSRVSLQPLDGSQARQTKTSWNDCAEVDPDYEYDGQKDDDTSDDKSSHRTPAPLRALTEDQILLCSTTLKGCSLKDKKW
ncbi:MAG: hypothetical protein Q9208_004201, partial [Pyrenodesmia sp. 3 TL-2023]